MLTNQKGYIKDFVLFLEEWQRDYNIVSNLKLELKSDHPNHEFYLQIKKRRLIYLYNIHESLLILNKDENSIFDLNKENSLVREFRFFENRFLFIKDEFLIYCWDNNERIGCCNILINIVCDKAYM